LLSPTSSAVGSCAGRPASTSGGSGGPGGWFRAAALYFHNGSVPTVYGVPNSKARPALYTRSYRTDLDVYAPTNLGWKVVLLDKAPDVAQTPAIEMRKVYDTTKPGRSNGGHIYGDDLTDAERRAVIEYLKTL
jgi:hypothetical protein